VRVLEQTRLRTTAAFDVLTGQPVSVPPAPRRWPWALGFAVLGAALATGAVLAARTLEGQDAPDAQEPSELQAVVDRSAPGTSG
jgi:hypothetical protein